LKELPKRIWPEKYPTAQKQPQKQQNQINQQPTIENSYQQMAQNNTNKQNPRGNVNPNPNPNSNNPFAYPNPFIPCPTNIPEGIPDQYQGMNSPEGLLQSICENVPYIQKIKITLLIYQFQLNKDTFARAPQQLLALMKGMPGAMPGEMAWMQFMANVPLFYNFHLTNLISFIDYKTVKSFNRYFGYIE
jgi:hypothetical protein